MSNEERVKKVVMEQLGVKEDQVQKMHLLLMI